MNFVLVLITVFVVIQKCVKCSGGGTIENVIRFPYSPTEGPFMGIFVAISLPLELPEYNIFFSYNMEANYNVPSNQSEFDYPPIVSKRSWDRKYLYDILEFKIKSHGYPGRDCLLRTICESAIYSTENTGVLGDLLHIILTPSISKNPGIEEDYELAELHGRNTKDCSRFVDNCKISFLGLISEIKNYFNV